jgi:hypothetical protein
METIIATIQPAHLGNIRSGKKLFEIRKTLPAPLKISHPVRCLCCESGSGGQIKAEFIIDKAHIETLDGFLRRNNGNIDPWAYIDGTCVQWKLLCDYMNNRPLQPIYFWHISNMIDYCNTKGYRVRNISEFGLKRPPQSWQYVKEA